jgi:hypothetical protein
MALSGALSILVTWFSIYLGGPLSYGVMQFWYCIVGFLQLQRARETVAQHEQQASPTASAPKGNFLVLCNLNAGGFVLALINLFVELQAYYTYAVFGSSVPRAVSLGWVALTALILNIVNGTAAAVSASKCCAVYRMLPSDESE